MGQTMDAMKQLVNVIAGAVLLLFAGIWLWIDWKVFRFTPSDEVKVLALSGPVITVAGFLGSAISTATAAVLGITVANAGNADSQRSIGARVNEAVSEGRLLRFGILTYFAIGFVTLIVWLANPNEAPDLTASFATGVLGWAVGAFSAVFKAQPGPGGGGGGDVNGLGRPPSNRVTDWSPPIG